MLYKDFAPIAAVLQTVQIQCLSTIDLLRVKFVVVRWLRRDNVVRIPNVMVIVLPSLTRWVPIIDSNSPFAFLVVDTNDSDPLLPGWNSNGD